MLVSFSGQGGVERMIANLTTAMAAMDIDLDLLLIKCDGPHVAGLPERANKILLRTKHTATSVLEVAYYLRKHKPDALLAVKHRAIIAALQARAIARTNTPIGGRLGTTVSAAFENKSTARRDRWYRAMRHYYPKMNAIIPVSDGVGHDIADITGIPFTDMTVIRNPVITQKLLEDAKAPVNHAWLSDNSIPVITGAGRLTEQKDFPTLLKAIAVVNQSRPARLLILGEGADRAPLEQLASDLSIKECVDFVGFQSNPWSWMAKSDVFVLSSRWEGSPNSLSEALALGVPVVSTDCPSGPKELLQGGKLAPLVRMGDHIAMADAIIQMLDNPAPADILQLAVAEYRADYSARRYLNTLGIPMNPEQTA